MWRLALDLRRSRMSLSRRSVCLLAAGATCAPYGYVFGQARPSSSLPGNAPDDPSRSELFRQFIEIPAENALAKAGQPFVLPRSFLFPRDTKKDDKGNPRKDQHFGIDISHHNGADIDFSALRDQNVRFCYTKAGQGEHSDPLFSANWSTLGQLQGKSAIYRGAYFFLSSQHSGSKQGDLFASLVGSLGPRDLPPVIDLEWDIAPGVRDQWADLDATAITKEVLACLSALEPKVGRRPMLYTAGSWLQERNITGGNLASLAQFPLWVADYSKSSLAVENPQVPSGFTNRLWQFTDRSQVPDAYDRGLDASIYHGTDQNFMSDFGVGPLPNG